MTSDQDGILNKPSEYALSFEWSSQRQGVILSSFFWGYVILQIPGGELAAKFGSKLLIIICIAVNSAISILIPVSAGLGGWQLVCACRVLQGLSQGFLYPSMHNIIGKWIPLQEKSSLGTIIYSGTKVARQYYVSARCLVRSWSECVDVVAALGRCRAPLLLLFTPCPGLARVRAGSQWGPALALIGLSYAPADTAIAVAILTAVVGLNAGHYTGYMLVHIDMSPNFAGPLMGITNCIANIISMIAPLIAGAILVDQSFFDWNSQRQGVILSSFLWGYVILKIPGGELAAKFGSKLLIIICIGVNSVVSMFIPISASLGGWQLVCACRVLQGLSQGFLYPSMHNIIGKWIPIQEKNSLGTIIYSVHFKDPIIRYSYKYRYS
ncbi:unnamed protein product [Diatraea saccharalis]|uniref:Major facilitator superfamily (MFS) profile domain-containing protein n=1 Tax=Diatraea saccharalis TaxID=40085 RepID=A0A9N9QZN3_9NEOP|nr:unnamed protein product [Diatraea saccharalis]